jgi:hypothetical protein
MKISGERHMAGFNRPVFHSEQLRPRQAGTGWSVLWEIRQAPDDGPWSAMDAGSEIEALERAQHFLKLGFWVHAIKDPLGAVVMNQQAIASHFGAH